ncbi:hypothetical protein ACHAXT_008616 [Thalassiosira profunda]
MGAIAIEAAGQAGLSATTAKAIIEPGSPFPDTSRNFCRLAPLWTVLAAGLAAARPSSIGRSIGSLPVMQAALAVLMLAMGLTITPDDASRALQKPAIILLNVLLCFGMMPLLAAAIGAVLNLSPEYSAGLILLGCVSGGQASNLFALLAGGDVALSVACTVTTTLLGAIAIPSLAKVFLDCAVVVDFGGVLKSVVQIVLLPLLLGLGMGKAKPSLVQRLGSVCPLVGVLATLVLVAGGASSCATVPGGVLTREYCTAVASSYLLPIAGGLVAWIVSYANFGRSGLQMEEKSRRTLVIETLSKSPTLAYVLAKKHFGQHAAVIPASGMVSLAIVGAAVSSIWAAVDPIEKY